MKAIKRLTVYLLCLAAMPALAEVYTGGIALSQTEAAAKQSVPVTDGNPQTVIALAMRHGKARGHFAGKAEEAMKKQFGKPIPIYIEAERMEKIPGKTGCHRVRVTYKTSPELAAQAPSEAMDIEACPNRR